MLCFGLWGAANKFQFQRSPTAQTGQPRQTRLPNPLACIVVFECPIRRERIVAICVFCLLSLLYGYCPRLNCKYVINLCSREILLINEESETQWFLFCFFEEKTVRHAWCGVVPLRVFFSFSFFKWQVFYFLHSSAHGSNS